MKFVLATLTIMGAVIIAGCGNHSPALFTRLSAENTGVTFRNLLKEDNEFFNVTTYPYFYNGGGVAVGDLNNDGLPDICFTGNMVKNRLYINQGDLRFKDVTDSSHIAEKQGWCTGVTMVDINGDGWLDIYICRSGFEDAAYRHNLLFINNHDLTFSEQAAAYGLDDAGYSTQAAFFDYDKDGDLDMFLVNHSSPQFSRGNTEYLGLKDQRGDTTLENKLYRNDGGHYHDVSSQAGIRSNKMTFSLGLVAADINMDGWPDVYVTNDFKEPDYLYINNGDGTFSEKLRDAVDHVSLYSMGCDVADYNNDLAPDILIPDMLPENAPAQKMHMAADNYNGYSFLFSHGMFYQYMRNTLQKNNGDGTFCEIGQLAGVSNTDWSWAPLIADFDNDGQKDFFITNGYKRDNTNVQFIMYSVDQSARLQHGGKLNLPEYLANMPPISLPDYVYRNLGNDRFENKTDDWGMGQDNVSHGAAYADLDNDGDLDLVVNHMDETAGIYRNNSSGNHWLRLSLRGSKDNPSGIGAKIFMYADGKRSLLEQQPVRGFQSAVDPTLVAGLGKSDHLDSLRIVWPDDRTQLLGKVPADQTLVLHMTDASGRYMYPMPPATFLRPDSGTIVFNHSDSGENDFNRQSLLLHSYAHNGPCLATADVNHDGLPDVFAGGRSDNVLFTQTANGTFDSLPLPTTVHGTRDAVFVDADNDGFPDLFLLDDGYGDYRAIDKLLLNDGHGKFIESRAPLPVASGNRSCVRAADIDGDGDQDLFLGGSAVYGAWPAHTASCIYLNDGKGHFTLVTKFNRGMEKLGLVTDACWADIDGDKIPDLVVCGEWMAPVVLFNRRDHLEYTPVATKQEGLWNSVLAGDFDKDGDTDLIIGNWGLNTQLHASSTQPAQLYAQDIDKNGSIDPVVTCYSNRRTYPFVGMDDLLGQVPSLKKKFYDYAAYASATVQDFLPDTIKPQNCYTLATTYFENTGKGFVPHELPVEMQYSVVKSLVTVDVNGDDLPDVIAFGNDGYNRIKIGRQDANHGMLFLGNGKGAFRYVPQNVSGINVRGDVKSALVLGNVLMAGVNNSRLAVYRLASSRRDVQKDRPQTSSK